MAWKTPAGQKKPTKPNKKTEDASFPGLKPASGQPAAAQTRYQQLQEDEVMVLKSIYGDDFIEHEAAHSAWKVCMLLGSGVYPM